MEEVSGGREGAFRGGEGRVVWVSGGTAGGGSVETEGHVIALV